MKKKLDIGMALSDALQHLITGKGRYLINCLFALGLGVGTSVVVLSSAFNSFSTMTYYDPMQMVDYIMSEMLMLIPFYILVGLVSLCIQCVFIKIVDDVIEKRDLTYGQQFSYVMMRLGRIILANIITLIPIVLFSLLMFASMRNMFFFATFPFLIMTLLLVAYGMMLMFIDHSIIVDDVSAIESIKRSFALVSHNFFRIIFTFLLLGIVGAIVTSIVGEGNLIIELVRAVVNVIVSLFMTSFLTTLYKQVDSKPEIIEDEIEYFENYE